MSKLLLTKYNNGNAYYLVREYHWKTSTTPIVLHLTSCTQYEGCRERMTLVSFDDLPLSVKIDAYHFNSLFRDYLLQEDKRIEINLEEVKKAYTVVGEKCLQAESLLDQTEKLKASVKYLTEEKDRLQKELSRKTKTEVDNYIDTLNSDSPFFKRSDSKINNNTQNTKEMNFSNVIPNLKFGKMSNHLAQDLALSMAGIAFRKKRASNDPDSRETFVVYNQETRTLIEVGDMKFDIDFYQMPVQQLNAGDITIIDGNFYIVDKQNIDGSLSVINPTTGTRSTKLARTNLFNMYFYTKIVSMFDFMGGLFNQPGQPSQNNNLFGSMNPMMIMMMGDKGGDMSSMMEMMMMAQLAGGNNIFNFGAQNLPPKQTISTRKKTVAKPVTKKAASK